MFEEKLTLGMVMHTVIPRVDKYRQENQKFITLGYISSSKPAWATRDPVSKQPIDDDFGVQEVPVLVCVRIAGRGRTCQSKPSAFIWPFLLLFLVLP